MRQKELLLKLSEANGDCVFVRGSDKSVVERLKAKGLVGYEASADTTYNPRTKRSSTHEFYSVWLIEKNS